MLPCNRRASTYRCPAPLATPPLPQGIACIIITTYLCFTYVRYVPFQTAWINGLQVAGRWRGWVVGRWQGRVAGRALGFVWASRLPPYMHVLTPHQATCSAPAQASFFASLSWASLLILLMAFFFQGSDKAPFTILLWTGQSARVCGCERT